jgi:hypothetical protein
MFLSTPLSTANSSASPAAPRSPQLDQPTSPLSVETASPIISPPRTPFYIAANAVNSSSTTSLPSRNQYTASSAPERPRSYTTSAPLSAPVRPPSPRDLPSLEQQHNHVQGLNLIKGLKLKLPDNPFTSQSTVSSQLGLSQPEIRTPASPSRDPRSARNNNSPLRSPSVSPRKRTATTGSRFSPPPAFGNRISSSSKQPPPPTPPLPRSPANFETGSSDYLNVPSPKPSPPKKHNSTPISDATTSARSIKLHQSTPALLGKGVITPSTSVHTTPAQQRQRAFTMAAESSRRAMRSASGTRPTHGRQFSTDMRQLSSDDVARQREQREQDRDRKAMLNRALQKAHTAVLLDNAYNYEGAIEAYREACNLLHQVLLRSTADEERRKLDQIVSLELRSEPCR